MAGKIPLPDSPSDPHPDVTADFEQEEGPPLGVHTGQDRTVIPEHAERLSHGRKTQQHIRDRISRRI